MKRFVLAPLLALTLLVSPNCAAVQKIIGVQGSPVSQASLLSYLSDIQWSLDAAHGQNWLTDADLQLGTDIVNAVTAAVQKNPAQAQLSARDVLNDLKPRLDANSRLHPYFDWFIKALGAQG